MITNTAIGKFGRFGNALFQMAAVIGIARRSGNVYGFRPYINHAHAGYKTGEDLEVFRHFKNTIHGIPYDERQINSFSSWAKEWGYEDKIFKANQCVNIHGYFQSDKYFNHCIDEVRHVLELKNELDPVNAIAIHVRRGDYNPDYHCILGEEYYIPAVNKMMQLTGCVDISVISDDPMCGRVISEMINKKTAAWSIYVSTGSYMDDFRFIKSHRHFITANSTFSLMAAILSNQPGKQIVCPKDWFGPKLSHYETKDLYPKNSIVI